MKISKMPTNDLGLIFAVDYYGFILGDVRIGEVDHHVLGFKRVLQGLYVNTRHVLAGFYGKSCRLSCCLPVRTAYTKTRIRRIR